MEYHTMWMTMRRSSPCCNPDYEPEAPIGFTANLQREATLHASPVHDQLQNDWSIFGICTTTIRLYSYGFFYFSQIMLVLFLMH